MTQFATTVLTRMHKLQLIRRSIGPLFAMLLMVIVPICNAEEAAAKPGAPPAEKTGEAPHVSGPIQYVGPDTYILLDSKGRPQPVPGMTYEDFLAAWKQMNHAAVPDSRPRFTIENIKFDGQTHGDRADLKLEITIHLLADGAVVVPLGLVGAILEGEPQFTITNANPEQPSVDKAPNKGKPTDKYIDFIPQRGGFVAHTAGAAGERQLLSMKLIVPLLRDAAETTLAINCPRSTASSLALIVDTLFSEARASSGTVTSKKSTTDGGTRIEVAGPAGQFRLTWQATSNDKASITSVLNAVGAIHVTIDGRGVRSDARLSVRSFGGGFDQFRVRLPRGAKLIPDPATAGKQDAKYRITEEPQSPGLSNTGQMLLVQLKDKQLGPVVVNLSTEQPGHDASQVVEIGGFEVLGAVRQYGDIGLDVANDWQARWNIGQDLRQVDPNELDTSLQHSDLTASFQYDRQPWSLGVRVSPRQSRVHVTPQFDLELLPEEARLNVRLAYQNFGARAFEFRMEMDGWELSGEPVESGGLVDQDRITVSPSGTLTFPLTQSSSRKAEVAFSLRHSLNRDASMIQLPLPAPLGDSVATGELVVRAPAEIELLPDLAHSTGLAASPGREGIGPANPDAPSELHFRSLSANAIFVAKRTKRERDQSAKIEVQIDIGPDSMQVDERIDFNVRYEPIKELMFDIPVDFPVAEEVVEVALVTPADQKGENTGQRTPLRLGPVANGNDPEALGTRRLRATLPQPLVGRFTVAVRYQSPRSQNTSSFSALEVPLLLPFDTRISSQHAVARAPKGVFLSLGANADSSSWKALEGRRKKDAAGPSYEFGTDNSEPTLPLIVSAADSNPPSTTVVDRVWLQTWLSGDVEQDRAAFRLRTSNSQTTIELPPDATTEEIEVLVDGEPAQVSSRAAGRIIVRLAKESQNTTEAAAEPVSHTLEIRFRRAIQGALITRHRITPPQIDATTELSQVYWQIVLPADEHIVQSPTQMVAASQWQWLGTFWGRRPVMSQVELEKWVGASAQIAPAISENQYLFTGLLPISSVAMVTAPRWLLVLLASTLALVLLASWFYLPVRTKSWMLMGVIIVLGSAAIAYPTAALLIAQASAIGVVLAPLSLFLSQLMARSTRRRLTPPMTASSQRVLTPRGDSIIMPQVVSAASTAPTVTLRTSDSGR